jgi:hypothetical protein
MRKMKIKRLINLKEKDGLKHSINRLKKRYRYLQSKTFMNNKSNQMKYILFHLRDLGVKS